MATTIRWRIIDAATRKPPAGLRGKTSYPSRRLAQAHCKQGERAQRCVVDHATGPFSDSLVIDDGDQETPS